ncbi:MAG: DUF1800 family protein [Pseudomonadota bacterium]
MSLSSVGSGDVDGAVVSRTWRDATGTVLGTGEMLDVVFADAGEHEVLLEVVDEDGLWAVASVLVSVVLGPPSTPVNTVPSEDSYLEFNRFQTFFWQGSALATSYDVRFIDGATGDERLYEGLDASDVCDGSFSCDQYFTTETPVGMGHSWGVRANNAAGSSAWSDFSFHVIPERTAAPVTPTLQSPADGGAVASGAEVAFTWQSDSQVTYYDLEIINGSDSSSETSNNLRYRLYCDEALCQYTQTVDVPVGPGHSWRVRARNRLGQSDWATHALSVSGPVPGIPVLQSPTDGAELNENSTVDFTWQADADASGYVFQLMDANRMPLGAAVNLTASTACGGGSCSYLVSLGLAANADYSWSVAANNASGTSLSSERGFRVVVPPVPSPDAPAAVSPAVDAALPAATLTTFAWLPAANASSYELQIVDAADGPQAVVGDLLASDVCTASRCETLVTTPDGASAGHLWRVRAANLTGASAWTERTFSTVVNLPPDPVAVFTASAGSGFVPFTLDVDGSASSDDVGIVQYRWAFADEQVVEGESAATATHTFDTPGSYEVVLTVTDGEGRSDQMSMTVTAHAALATAEEAARLLTQASFGPTLGDIDAVRRLGVEGWIDNQLLLKGPPHLDYVQLYSNGSNRSARHEKFWLDAVDGEDQLRQRVAFALSQLLVISDTGYTLSNTQYGVTHYYDILRNEAFGSYRELLEQITLSPIMGIYLSMLQNDKGRPESNTRADENFAREVLQLFSIGLYNLSLDGTRAAGKTYTQEQIEAFARVFTGWNYADAGNWNRPLFTGQDMLSPMEPFEDHHDTGAKALLNGAVLPEGQSARVDLEAALDNIFAHANVGPFIATHLITQLVTSNPTPQYVARVATVFNDNGLGVRGDLGATVKAILMDTEARTLGSVANFGKMREPVLRFSHLWRAFSVSPGNWSDNGEYETYSPQLQDMDSDTGQAPLKSPSVFNFFSPSYSPQGPAQNNWLVVPEMQIFTDSNILKSASRVNRQIYRHYLQNSTPSERNPAYLDYSREIALANDPQALLDHLNLLLLSGAMSDALETILLDHISTLEDDEDGLIERVQDAIALIVASPDYLVQK